MAVALHGFYQNRYQGPQSLTTQPNACLPQHNQRDAYSFGVNLALRSVYLPRRSHLSQNPHRVLAVESCYGNEFIKHFALARVVSHGVV